MLRPTPPVCSPQVGITAVLAGPLLGRPRCLVELRRLRPATGVSAGLPKLQAPPAPASTELSEPRRASLVQVGASLVEERWLQSPLRPETSLACDLAQATLRLIASVEQAQRSMAPAARTSSVTLRRRRRRPQPKLRSRPNLTAIEDAKNRLAWMEASVAEQVRTNKIAARKVAQQWLSLIQRAVIQRTVLQEQMIELTLLAGDESCRPTDAELSFTAEVYSPGGSCEASPTSGHPLPATLEEVDLSGSGKVSISESSIAEPPGAFPADILHACDEAMPLTSHMFQRCGDEDALGPEQPSTEAPSYPLSACASSALLPAESLPELNEPGTHTPGGKSNCTDHLLDAGSISSQLMNVCVNDALVMSSAEPVDFDWLSVAVSDGDRRHSVYSGCNDEHVVEALADLVCADALKMSNDKSICLPP